MTPDERAEHWQAVYAKTQDNELSWFEATPLASLEMIAAAGLPMGASIVDVGGGVSHLADELLQQKFVVTALDISKEAIQILKERLATKNVYASLLVRDITNVHLQKQHYDLWHDRAVFHFLTDPDDRVKYMNNLRHALKPGGYVVIATFATDGPTKCSGLVVQGYNAHELHQLLGNGFVLIQERFETHVTPSGKSQQFMFAVFRQQP